MEFVLLTKDKMHFLNKSDQGRFYYISFRVKLKFFANTYLELWTETNETSTFAKFKLNAPNSWNISAVKILGPSWAEDFLKISIGTFLKLIKFYLWWYP